MKLLHFFINILLVLILLTLLSASIGSFIYKKPFMLSSIKSNSMYPKFQRGDIILLSGINEDFKPKINDIVIFKSEDEPLKSKGYVVHRIISGNQDDGYITKGDNNPLTDQESRETGPIKPQWIVNKVITFNNNVVKIPLLGYLPLFADYLQKGKFALPILTILVAIIIGINEYSSKKKRKKTKLNIPTIYVVSGFTISMLILATNLAICKNTTLNYEVSDKETFQSIGSSIGNYKIGSILDYTCNEVKNNSIFPMYLVMTTQDRQIHLTNSIELITSNSSIKPRLQLHANKEGNYSSTINTGLFLPFLPKPMLEFLAKKNFYLALFIISIIPGIPLILYPLFNSNSRRLLFKTALKKFRYLKFVN